jgi:D-alanine transfer protein
MPETSRGRRPAAFSSVIHLICTLRLRSQSEMLRFPGTLAKGPLLRLAAARLASGHPVDRIVLMAIWPLGKLQNAILDLQDHFEALIYILGTSRGTPQTEWRHSNSRKAADDSGQKAVTTESLDASRSDRDAAFRARIAAASEWIDLELLFRAVTELGAQPLILSMPIDNTRHDMRGVSRSARQVYYERMSQLAQRYHFPLIQFEDHDADPGFLIAHREHPTPQGWMYYDRALDDFFHKNK